MCLWSSLRAGAISTLTSNGPRIPLFPLLSHSPQYPGQIGIQWALNLNQLAIRRAPEYQRGSMQKHSPEPIRCHHRIISQPITGITGNRVPQMCCMNTNLVGTAGNQINLTQVRHWITILRPDY